MNQLIKSLKRLYENHKIDESKVIELFTNDVITENEKGYILNK